MEAILLKNKILSSWSAPTTKTMVDFDPSLSMYPTELLQKDLQDIMCSYYTKGQKSDPREHPTSKKRVLWFIAAAIALVLIVVFSVLMFMDYANERENNFYYINEKDNDDYQWDRRLL